MDEFVIDVSMCMPWCCEDEATASSERLLQLAADRHPLHVPSLWPWEMMNALAVAGRRQRISAAHAANFFALLPDFDFRIEAPPGVLDLPRLNTLALRHHLTAYDAAYLELAMRRSLPLATLDEDLKKAAVAEGVLAL